MPEKLVYEYASIRLVPKVEREEFLNIGLIVFSKRKKFLDLKYHLDAKRLSLFSNEVELKEIEDYLKTWKLICQGHPNGGKIAEYDQSYRFRWITAPKSTIIQCSKVHPGLCNEPEEVLDILFKKYVM
ncbi:MAG: DUF3037 domain-containing protein [Bacteroidota bacterium]